MKARIRRGAQLLAPAALAPIATVPLSAHGLAAESLRRWTFEPFTVTLLAASAAIYAAGLVNLWRRAGRGKGLPPWRVAAFAAGVASAAAAVISPIAWLSQVLFSVHMTQHEILMLISAPLMVFGQPLLVALWALPPSWREAVGRTVKRPSIARSWRGLTAPFAVFVLHGFAIWIWHSPRLYEAALASDGLHAFEHLCFVLTAALFWWGMVHGRYGRIGYGLATVYVFLTAVHSSVLGALMTIAPGVWYPVYGPAGAAWHINPLEDQQLAGLLMWVPSGVIFIVFGLALFAAWLGESERRAALGMTAAASARAHDAA